MKRNSPILLPSRRGLLRGAVALGGATAMSGGLAMPRPARAAAGSPSGGTVSGADLKYLFVFAGGGWDPTRVFADGFDNSAVDMESSADRGTAGGITYVDAPDRPSVRSFFENYHQQTVIFNGVMVRSIAHEICTMIALTGTTSGLVPDWPAILGGASGDRYTLPHLVMTGPSFPGDLGEAVVRSGTSGQLDALLSGEISSWSDSTLNRLSSPSQGILDNYVRRRSLARADGAKTALDRSLASAYSASVEKSVDLKDLRYVMSFAGASDLASAGSVAVQALSLGLARCVSVTYPIDFGGEWDTHVNNDAQQSPLWEGLFSGLLAIFDELESTPGEVGGTLADEVVVVVMSEMGRTPALNGLSGKDHWPYTSVMVSGPNLEGSRVIGGFDASWYGELIDPSTGDNAEAGGVLSAESVGATLLALGDVDPDSYVSGVEPITGALA